MLTPCMNVTPIDTKLETELFLSREATTKLQKERDEGRTTKKKITEEL